jgi:ABC-type lipoprotein release transport system permease subunit
MRVLDSLLLPQTTADPWRWILVPLFVATVALVASLVPARRAARTDPIVALRGV